MKLWLILIFLLIGTIPATILRGGILRSYETKAVSNRSIDILSQARILGNQIIFNNYLEDTSSEIINSQLEQLSNIYDGRVMIIDGNFRIVKDTYGVDEGKTIVSEEVIRSFSGEEISKHDSDNGYIEMTIPLTDTESKESLGVFLVSVSTDSIKLNLEYLKDGALVIEISMLLVVLALSVMLSMRLVRPLSDMSRQISEIQNGFATELKEETYLETEDISHRFNQLFERMKVIDESREEFVSNVSHELKTPLTSMKVLADSLNGQENVPLELYREFMGDIGNEIDRETKIINDLLSLVKMDRSAADLNISSVNINEQLELILKRLRPIAEKQNIELVEDGGIGIPEESLEHIYERFYRVDKSHSREIGGTGLGLAITRNAILMHRGAIKVFSTEGEGTIFNVRIPLNYIAS